MTAPRQPQPLGSSDRAEPGIPQKIIDLYDDYTHLTLDRRRFFDHLTRVAGGTAAAYALLPLLENNYAAAALVAPDDARVATETVSFPGAHGELTGYMARPAGDMGRLPAVLIIHENRGLHPPTADVVRRMALEGFVALGVDFLATPGRQPAPQAQARGIIGPP